MKKNFLATSLIIISNVLSLFAQNNNSSENWKPIFKKYNVKGTFVLYDISSQNSQIFNAERSDSSFLPASTFKILNSLIALENRIIKNEFDTIYWDGKERPIKNWNQDHTLKSAFSVSCVPCYQEIARRIGENRMQKWIDTVGYGNSKMGGQIDNFWLEGDLRISAKEQVTFIERLINNDLPFDTLIQERVKEIMISDSTDSYILHSKTGLVMRIPPPIGWFVGYIKSEKGTWIFALNIDINTKSDAKYRKQITYEILKNEGIME